MPTLALLALGHPELTIYAVFGAFTGMYGRAEPHPLRRQHQLRAAILLVSGVGVGVLLSALHVTTWTLVSVSAVLAAAGSVFADRSGLRPSGPFFGLFALGACASVPLGVAPITAITIAVGSAGFSMVVGFAGWFRHRRPLGTVRRSVPHGPVGLNALCYLLAVGVAGSVSALFGLSHPIWAMAAAAVPLAVAGLSDRVRRGAHRVLGTLLGVGVTAVILLPFGMPAPAVLVLLVIALQFPTELFMTRNYGLALVFFTPLILLMTQLAHPTDSVELLIDRAGQTLLGASVGIAVAVASERGLRGRRIGAEDAEWNT